MELKAIDSKKKNLREREGPFSYKAYPNLLFVFGPANSNRGGRQHFFVARVYYIPHPADAKRTVETRGRATRKWRRDGIGRGGC